MKINQQIGEFDRFITLYLHEIMFRHHPSIVWNTEEKCVKLLGGVKQIYDTYVLWKQSPKKHQLAVCGCTPDHVRFMLEAYEKLGLKDSDETLQRLVDCLDILGAL